MITGNKLQVIPRNYLTYKKYLQINKTYHTNNIANEKVYTKHFIFV